MFLLFTVPLFAQEPLTTLFGQNWLNGHAWRMLDSHAKLMYVTAFGEGTGIATINWLMTGQPKSTEQEFERQGSFYISDAAFTGDDTAEQIDKFYAVNRNLEIPVAHAFLFVIYKFRGASPQELETYTAKLRNMAAERSGHVAPPIRKR